MNNTLTHSAGYGSHAAPHAGYGRSNSQQALISLFNFMESAIFFILIIFFSGAVAGYLFTDMSNPDADSPMGRAAWFPIYALVLLVSIRSLPQVLRLCATSPLILICVMICGISMLWSIDPGITMRRSVALTLTTLMGLALAARYGWGPMVQHIAFAYGFLAVFTVIIVLVDPARGLMQEIHAGAWRGPWIEKNYLGGNMTKGLAACMCAFALRPDRFWLWLPAGFLCFALVILSTSKTSLLVSLIAIILFIGIRIFRRFPGIRIPLLYFSVMALSIFLIAILAFPEEMFALIGKDPTFTGRTEIWDILIADIKKRFALGYGYGAYWMDPLGPSYYVRQQLEWPVPTAHNGWIEIWLSCGALIVAVFGLLYMATLLLAVNRIGRGGVEVYWAVLYTLIFLFFSMSESTILAQNELTWVMFVATSAKLTSFERPYWRKRKIR